MKKILIALFVAVLFCFSGTVDAAPQTKAANQKASTQKTKPANKKSAKPAKPTEIYSPPYADIVIDVDTGEILHETASTEPRHPASLTKMMTLYLTFQALEGGHISMNDEFYVSKNATLQEPSKLWLAEGSYITVENAILGLVTKSANDVAVVVAEALGGSVENFARIMNKQAKLLGMDQTIFFNPSGLPDTRQVTTARDMAIMAVAVMKHYDQYYSYFSTAGFTYAGNYYHNHNRLMQRYEGMDGVKTGYIRASGFNLAASAKREGKHILAIVFGGKTAQSRDDQVASLLDRSFGYVGSQTGLKKGKEVAKKSAPVERIEVASLEERAENQRAIQEMLGRVNH
ncbi:MAG: D-alanyl-D-alanine carboxypeptidase [Alphaproteobacteria bacterium]|nr:D-alanyl-D-alanine carboxypeptidase [Alphaproteobacteria bacterium]MCL2505545.1 D-alanyl-D-alanine carboxypeptidase [Alphaproteobacteria bacterium]